MPYCYNCFREYAAGSGPCPHCGYDPPKDQGKYPFALPHGSILAGQFITGRVLGQGGFGITYLALDNRLKSRVAIKEFLPDSMAVRTAGTPQITVYTGQRQENFQYGMERFLDEAKVLAKFQGNPHIVGVRSYFEENGTAYFVMDYIEGESFKAYIQDHGGRIPWKEALRILMPVMDALGAVHTEGIIHRDVTPDNIFVTGGGGVKLLDFGSARYSLGDKSRSLDVVLKAGYAPKEQYTRRGRQGPYTDVYSLAACFYSAITGYLPPESLDRADEDDLVLPSTRGIEIPQAVEDVILHGLEVQPADRYQSMEEFRSAMSEAAAEPGEEPEAVPVESAPPEPETDSLSDIQSAPAAEKPRFPEDAGGGAPVGKAEAAGQGSATVSGPKAPLSRRVKYGVLVACFVLIVCVIAITDDYWSINVRQRIETDHGSSPGTIYRTEEDPGKSEAPDHGDVNPDTSIASTKDEEEATNVIFPDSEDVEGDKPTEQQESAKPFLSQPTSDTKPGPEAETGLDPISVSTPPELALDLNSESESPIPSTPIEPSSNTITAGGKTIRDDAESVDLSYKKISDISSLVNLTNVTELWLGTNKISDISPLANLTGLTTLDLTNNQISDISSLAKLKNLTWLSLWNNKIVDISVLKNLIKLSDLDLSGNKINSISVLSSLTNLVSLSISYNEISDLSPLSNLTDLKELYLWDCQISDINSLSNLTNLNILALGGNTINDFSPLENLKNLTRLGLYKGQISEDQIAKLQSALPRCTIYFTQ